MINLHVATEITPEQIKEVMDYHPWNDETQKGLVA